MKELVIVSAALGPETLSAQGLDALKSAEVWFGADRLLGLYESLRGGRDAFPYYRGRDILKAMEENPAFRFAVLVSGDAGFYSAASGLVKELAQYKPRLIPGVSSLAFFAARLGCPWQDAAILSAHGRDTAGAASELTALVRRNRKTFCLADSNAAVLGRALCGAGFDSLAVHVGENLGRAEERIYTTDAAAFSRSAFPELTVLLVINEEASDRIPAGLPDSAFVRAEGIPMTKSAVRAVCLSRLALGSGETVWDIGAGTGSVSVEMALAAWRGRVFAVEKEPEAAALIQENCRRFHAGNVTVISGEAPDVLAELPPPGAVFIGGSGGNLESSIAAVRAKNPGARIVATAVTIETAAELLAALPHAELTQISAAWGRKAGNRRLLIGQNPVMIISDTGTEADR
jgi:precorrin-6Y C5,15-methyltransferase (decarboxylating)